MAIDSSGNRRHQVEGMVERTKNRLRVLLLLALPVFWIGTLGCSGTCGDLRDHYDATVRLQIARAGTGFTTIGSGGIHLGMTFSAAVIRSLLWDATRDLSSLHTRLTVEGSRQGSRVAAEIFMQPSLEEITVLGDARQGVRVLSRLEARVTVRTPGHRLDRFLLGSFSVGGRLVFENDHEGVPELVLIMEQLEDEFDLGSHDLSEAVLAAVVDFARPALSRMLFGEGGRLKLARFPPLLIGSLLVSLSAAEMQLFPEDEAVFLGFFSNLRLFSSRRIEPSPRTTPDGLRLVVNPEFFEAAIGLALAEGRMPRQFNERGEWDSEGSILATLDQAVIAGERVILDFTAWDITQAMCLRTRFRAMGSTRIVDDQLVVVVDTVAPVDLDPLVDINSSPSLQPEFWRGVGFVTQSFVLVERLLRTSHIRSGMGLNLFLTPLAMGFEEDHLWVDLELGDVD